MEEDDFLRLPVWRGNPAKDSLTCEEWLDCVVRAKESSNWDFTTTVIGILNSLDDGALEWFNDLVTNVLSNTTLNEFLGGLRVWQKLLNHYARVFDLII
jgi:hypothetical protein